jgi:hypothetical protein
VTSPQPHQVDPQRIINRLAERLAEAELRAAQYAALADQLLDEARQRGDGQASVTPPAAAP